MSSVVLSFPRNVGKDAGRLIPVTIDSCIKLEGRFWLPLNDPHTSSMQKLAQ